MKVVHRQEIQEVSMFPDRLIVIFRCKKLQVEVTDGTVRLK